MEASSGGSDRPQGVAQEAIFVESDLKPKPELMPGPDLKPELSREVENAQEQELEPKPEVDDTLCLSVPGIGDLSGLPRDRYESVLRRVAVDVLKEASLQATGQARGARKRQAEFHSSHIEAAARTVAERGLVRKKTPWWYSWGRIIQSIFTVAVAASGSFMAGTNAPPFWSFIFVGAATVTIVLLVVLEIADRSLGR